MNGLFSLDPGGLVHLFPPVNFMLSSEWVVEGGTGDESSGCDNIIYTNTHTLRKQNVYQFINKVQHSL